MKMEIFGKECYQLLRSLRLRMRSSLAHLHLTSLSAPARSKRFPPEISITYVHFFCARFLYLIFHY